MTITTPPRRSEIEKSRDLERRVADLEALIEEARRRARRRRTRRGAAALLIVAAGVVAFIGFGGDGGGGPGTAATTHARSSKGATANAASPLGALPVGTGFVDSFAFDPRNPQIVYVMTYEGPTGAHVLKSTDGGAHWHATASSGGGWAGANEALTADPRHPGTIYAGTAAAVYKSVNGGRSWRPSHRGLVIPPAGSPNHRRDKGWLIALAVDPANTTIVYAGSDRVSRSQDGGQTWKTIFQPGPTRYRENVSALAIAPTDPETVYAVTGDFTSGLTTIFKSSNAGSTWQAATVVHGIDSMGFDTALAVDPRHPATVYAAVNARVLKTTNAGATWQSVARGLPVADGHGGVTTLAVDPRRSGTVYAAVTQGGIYKTTNGGQTWRHVSPAAALGVPLNMYTVAVDPARPSTVFAAGLTETGAGPRIFRSTNSGRTWATAR